MHAQIGEALEVLHEANADDHLAELAYHFARAELVFGPEKVVHYSLLAGEQALSAYSWGEALEAMKNEQEAIAKFEKVVELAPQDARAQRARDKISLLKESVAAK